MAHTTPCFKTPGSGRVGSKRSARKSTTKRHSASAWLSISKPSIKRLARRAGIIRISREFYDEASKALKAYLRRCMSKIVPLTEYAKRTTVISNDVAYALKQMGTTLYMEGCDWTYKQYTREYVRRKVVRPVEQRYLQEAAARRTASLAASACDSAAVAEQIGVASLALPEPAAAAPQVCLADEQQQGSQTAAVAAVQAAQEEAGWQPRPVPAPAVLQPMPEAAGPMPLSEQAQQGEEGEMADAGTTVDAAAAEEQQLEEEEEEGEGQLVALPALQPALSAIKPAGGEPVTPAAATRAATGKPPEPSGGVQTPGVMTPERVKEVQVWLSDVIHGPLSEHGCMRCDHLKTVMRSRHSVSPEEVDDLLYALDKQERIILSDGCLYLAA